MFRKFLFVLPFIVMLAIIYNYEVKAEEVETEISADKDRIIINRTDYPVLYLTNPNIEGEAVWMLQARLKELGFDISPNGIFSPATNTAVRLFQVANGLKDTGVVNKIVWENLMQNEAGEPCITDDDRLLDGKVIIEIDTSKRFLVVYQNDKEVVRYPVAVGKSETPSPIGEWRIVQKSLNWGNGFGTRWLGLNVPWGIFGIHGTNKPGSIGSYASHGCIRMFNRDVEKLYPLIPLGTTVRIVKEGRMVPEKVNPIPLKKGSSGQQVVYVQGRLKELGYEFDRADGRYGNMTELAVKYYQIWHGLEVNGEMNEETYRSMGMIE